MNALVATTVLLALAWFAATNLVASALAWAAGAFLRRREAAGSAAVLLCVRLFPPAASLLITILVFVPVHLATETRGLDESFGWVLDLAAAAGAFLIVRALWRACALALADRRLRSAERPSTVVPGTTESPEMIGLALAGLVRTRIVLDARVAAALTRSELDVAIAHEVAHRRAADNLKRCAFYCAPDFFGMSRMAGQIERAWHAAAESLADARAAQEDDRRAVDLASALVKVARLMAATPTACSPVWSTFNDPALLRVRVRQLASGAPPAPEFHPVRAAFAAVAVVASLAMLAPLLAGPVHLITEAAVALLP